jgi:hypothetical protein
MKRKKTSPVKKKKEVPETREEISIIDKAKLEKELDISVQKAQQAKGESRMATKEVFKMWCVLPDQFKGAPERITSLLGITDSVTLELLAIPTMQAFATEFGVIPPTLSRWRRDIETGSDYMTDVKRVFKPLTRNLIAALYRKAMEEGDAQRFTAWMKIVEDWREQLGIEHSGDIGEGLTEEERKAIDHLIAKNTAP